MQTILNAQRLSPEEMTNQMLITHIQSHTIEDAYPHMLEVIERITEDKEANEKMRSLLLHTYYELARHHYNEFLKTQSEEDGKECIEFSQKLRELEPNGSQAPISLQFEIHIHELNKDWEAMRASLSQGLKGIEDKLYPSDLKFGWLESICYSYSVERKWEEGLPYFIEADTDLLSPTRLKTLAGIYLIQAYEALKQPEKALPLLPALQNAKDDRYDPNLNFSLFKLGNQLSDKEAFSSANYMYFLCLTIEDIIEYNSQKLDRLQAYRHFQQQRNIETTEAEIGEIKQLEAYLASLTELTSYTGPLKYQRAQNLERMGRKYDAFFAFLRLINEHPEHPSVQLFHYTAFNQADEIDYTKDAIDLGERYLATDNYKSYRKEVIVKLVALYFQAEDYEKLYALGSSFIDEHPGHEYGNNVAHFMGFAWMRENKIEEARKVLGGYLQSYPVAPLSQAANYWLGLGNVIEQEFEAAAANFDHIIERYPEGSFIAEARFRRAVCDFGMGDYEAAETGFTEWVASYPQNHLRGEAEVFLGDIDAYYAAVAESLQHYASVESYTGKMNLINHAYFESARLLDANERYEAMIQLLQQYMDHYQETGNLTQAILQIGQAYESLGQPEVMVQSYYEAIVEYGNNPKAEGVDEIFMEFAKKYSKFNDYYVSTIEFLDAVLTDEAFRLQMIDDRKALHLYRLKHPEIDSDLIDRLIRDKKLRHGLGRRELPRTREAIEAGAPIQYDTSILADAKSDLVQLQENFKLRLSRFPKEDPETQLVALHSKALSKGERTLELRLLAAFEQMQLESAPQTAITIQDLPYASPATLAWIGESMLHKDPALASLAIDRVLTDHPESLAAPSAYYTKSKMLEAEKDITAAIQVLDFIAERFPTWPQAPEVTLRAATLTAQLNDYPKAIERYLSVLQVRDWRGEAWAEACFRIATCYEATGDTLKAHGFYERTYLSYRQFQQWAGKAYYNDGRLLEGMKETESAKAVYKAYMALPNAAQLPDIDDVRERYETL
ncbi:tetratricopeptide repeat protein [Coraliomargarita akajimensis]|uniref:tetratricopeptide repeat protein n=1 Tax=Coraliomargarita akajimensis TaxID=395922 RepID=UPI001C2602D5|nr:tetratricopeptide repeat protein [Coraliomargarita akajimensis]